MPSAKPQRSLLMPMLVGLFAVVTVVVLSLRSVCTDGTCTTQPTPKPSRIYNVQSFDECVSRRFPVTSGMGGRICTLPDGHAFADSATNGVRDVPDVAVFTPKAGAFVGKSFILSGIARTPDNTVRYVVRNMYHKIIGYGRAPVSGQLGQFGNYSTRVTLQRVGTKTGSVEVFEQLSDGSNRSLISIPVRLMQ